MIGEEGKPLQQAAGLRCSCVVIHAPDDLRVDEHEEPIGELRRIFEWFRPLLPYYSERPYNPRLPRDDRWRDQQRN